MIDLSDEINCIDPSGYAPAPLTPFRRTPVKSGRSRFQLTNPSYMTDVQILAVMDDAEFHVFKKTWEYGLDHGTDPFTINLLLGTALQTATVHAKTPYQIKTRAAGYWEIVMLLEIQKLAVTPDPICGIIFAGTVWRPATDEIVSGPIDDLPADVIEPCPGVI